MYGFTPNLDIKAGSLAALFLYLYRIKTTTYQKVRTDHSIILNYSAILNFQEKKNSI
jgi:hypothetical protein